MVLLASSRMSTHGLLRTYLLGVDQRLPYPLLLAARSQLELFAVVADTVRVIRENAGQHEDQLVQRVARVDKALIKATYGTRSQFLKELFPLLNISRLREPTSADLEVLTATNVLSRLQRLAKEGTYPECERDYERLCEYVHPNWGMNQLLVVPHPSDDRLLRFSTISEDPYSRALEASCKPMWRATEGTLRVFDRLEPPFGAAQITHLHWLAAQQVVPADNTRASI
jgi:hypothetical protein